MRSSLLIIGTVLVIALIGGVYVWLQPAPPQTTEVIRTTSMPSLPPPPVASTGPATQPLVGTGENIWVKIFDEKTGRLAWQFRDGGHQPQPDGSVNVTHPQAEFFLDDGQIITIDGSHGRMVVPAESTRTSDMRGQATPPSRGELYDVTITRYADARRAESTMTCTVNNLAFDNDTLRIATQAIKKDDGTVTPADQVPVQVRGQDADFDGRGLIIHWNGLDRTLQSLEIAHGESMTVRQVPNEPASAPRTTTTPPATPARGATARRTTPATQQTAGPTTKRSQPVYQATFDGGVRVTQGGQPVAVSDTLRFAFRPDHQESDSSQSTRQTPPARGGRSAARGATPQPAPAPTTRPARTSLFPTTGPHSNDPVTINWGGKLTIVPVDSAAAALKVGQESIELNSQNTPVVVDYNGMEFKAASLFYNGADNSMIARTSDQVPLVTMTTDSGTQITTPSLRFDGVENKAYLEGKSVAHLVSPATDTSPGRTLGMEWSQSCVLTMASNGKDATGQEKMSLRRAEIHGDVDLSDPQMRMRAQTVIADLAPGSGQDVQLSKLDATGQVQCDLLADASAVDGTSVTRHLNAETLSISTVPGPDGKLVPRTLLADGNVLVMQGTDELRAGHVDATLTPTTQPAIERLFAQRDVTFKSNDSSGKADQLEAIGDPAAMNVNLSGQPATISSKDSSVSGPIIRISMKEQTMDVVGPGTLHGVQKPASATQPAGGAMDLTWNGNLSINGAQNSGVVNGDVKVTAGQPERHATLNATSNRLTLELADAPSTQPATTKPASPFDAFKAKTVRSLLFDGNTVVQSVQSDLQGAPQQRMNLFAAQLRLDDPQGGDQSRLVVPGPGQLLYENLQKPTSQPATSAPAGMGSMSGPTAFKWSQELVVDQKTQEAQMRGDVVIVHQQADNTPMRLQAPLVRAQFEPGDKTAENPEPKLKRLIASDGVQFFSNKIDFGAQQLDFDAQREELMAKGTESAPIQIFDDNGVSTGTAQQVFINTRTEQIDLRGLQMLIRR